MKRLLTLLVPALVLVGCASKPLPASSASSTSDQTEVTEVTEGTKGRDASQPATVKPSGPRTTSIKAGAWPLSNAHQWGMRAFEVRDTEGVWQVRVRDAISFQGVGMSPEQMAPPNEECTAWETLPNDVAVHAKLSSLDFGENALVDAQDAAGVLRAWFESTATPVKPRATTEPSGLAHARQTTTFGRTGAGC